MNLAHIRAITFVLAPLLWADSAQSQQLCTLGDPVVTIGKDTPAEFGRIVGATFLNDSILIVADGRRYELLAFDVRGRYLGSAGSSGDGPGEFRVLTGVTVRSDTVVAMDPALRRLSLFSFPLSYLESVSYSLDGIVRPFALLPNRALLLGVTPIRGEQNAPRETQEWMTVYLQIRDQRLTPLNVAHNARTISAVSGGQVFFTLGPFSVGPRVIAAGEQIVVADASSEIRRFTLAGKRLPSVTSPFARRPVTGSMVNRWLQEHVRQASDRRFVERELRETPPPDSLPAHNRIVVDAAGTVWIQEYTLPWDDSAGRVIAVDRGGVSRKLVQLRSGSHVIAASTRFLAVRRVGEFDVESIMLFRTTCAEQ